MATPPLMFVVNHGLTDKVSYRCTVLELECPIQLRLLLKYDFEHFKLDAIPSVTGLNYT